MAVRILLLVLATGLYAAAWSGDSPQPAKEQSAGIRPGHGSRTRPAAAQRPARTPAGAPSPVARNDTAAIVRDEPRRSCRHRESLPAHIAPGVYRVVSDTGDVRTVTVEERDLTEDGVCTTWPYRDAYVVKGDNRKWYFIRIDADAEATHRARAPQQAGRQRRSGTASVDFAAVLDEVENAVGLSAWEYRQQSDRLERRLRALVGSERRRIGITRKSVNRTLRRMKRLVRFSELPTSSRTR